MENPCLDDSLCILYEKVTVAPEVEIVHEVINNSAELEASCICDGDLPSADALPNADSSVVLEKESSSLPKKNKRPQPGSVTRLSLTKTAQEPITKNKQQKIECGICFDGPDEISESDRCLMSTICGHVFCDSCLKVSMSNSSMCPKCRKRLGKKQFHPIYF